MYSGGYTGGGTTITLKLIMYTVGEYFMYMLIIMILMYLCFGVFIHNEPKQKIPVDTTDTFLDFKKDGYAEIGGIREINVT
jgi:hypothetical protein